MEVKGVAFGAIEEPRRPVMPLHGRENVTAVDIERPVVFQTGHGHERGKQIDQVDRCLVVDASGFDPGPDDDEGDPAAAFVRRGLTFAQRCVVRHLFETMTRLKG